MDRKDNLGVRVRDSIIHCNREFTIIDIRVDEDVDGMVLYIKAVDLNMANRDESRLNEINEMGTKMMNLIKKMTEKGLGGL